MSNDRMPVLSLHQPWATWIARARKTIETRPHARYRGLLGRQISIHAAMRLERAAWVIAAPYQPIGWEGHPAEFGTPQMPAGALVATAVISGVRPMTTMDCYDALCDWSPGRWAYVFCDVRPLRDPIYLRGHQGIWYMERSLIPWEATCPYAELSRRLEGSVR